MTVGQLKTTTLYIARRAASLTAALALSLAPAHAAAPDTTLITVAQMDSVGRILVEESTREVAPKAEKKARRDWDAWRPDPKRSMWLAIVLPGAGQIYNRKFWKLPIFYGGFVGCAYAMRWNDQMYKDYSQAYLDIMDDNPATQTYNQFLHLGAQVTEANTEQYKTIFKRRKDMYRRWRDLSFFCIVGVYALSVIDAYVDASLSEFDVSGDLSLRLAPALLNDSQTNNPLKSSALGLQCNLTF